MIREYGLIGYPLSHSFSQKYFNAKFQKEQIVNAVFHAFSIPTIDDLPAVLQSHAALQGFAVTIPYKRAVIRFLNEASPEVREMDACNCVKIKDGKLSGFNTDVIGFHQSFVLHRKSGQDKALVLGTGGAASAVQFVLKRLAIPYLSISRSANESKNIRSYREVTPDILQEYTIVINATPLGTYPNVDECPPIPYEALSPRHYLFDLVYNPSKTKFLLRGEQHGATIQNGYEMLVFQAEENWKIWNE